MNVKLVSITKLITEKELTPEELIVYEGKYKKLDSLFTK